MISSALGIIGGVLAAAVLLGAAFAALRASDLRNTVKDQQSRITSLKTDRDELERDLREEKLRREKVEGRLALIEERCNHLEEIVSGRIDFTALQEEITRLHREQLSRLAAIEKKILEGQRDIKALLDAKRAGDGDQ